MLITKFLKNK